MKENRGLLKPGFIADLSIFKHNLFDMPVEQFLTEHCLMTVVDEQIVFKE